MTMKIFCLFFKRTRKIKKQQMKGKLNGGLTSRLDMANESESGE